MRTFWVSLSYATFIMVSKDSIVIDVPPIVKWMLGKSLSQIKPWLLNKKASVIEL